MATLPLILSITLPTAKADVPYLGLMKAAFIEATFAISIACLGFVAGIGECIMYCFALLLAEEMGCLTPKTLLDLGPLSS